MAKPLRVLHVDDDPTFLELAGELLARQDPGLQVTTATSADEGLARLADDPGIECVVSDYEMPGTDGLGFLQRLREDHPNLPFLLFTSRGSEEVASEAISAGVTDYLQKAATEEQFAVLANSIHNHVERYRTERALAESEQKYRQLVEQSHDGIYIHRADEFLFVNDRLCEITGYDEAELLDQPAWTLIHPEDRDRAREVGRRRAAGDDVARTYEARIVTADGAVRHCEFAVRRITYEGEGASLGSVRDITERRERERQFDHQRERVEEVAAIVSHDLRNPLNVAAGRVDLYRTTGDEEHLDRVEPALKRMESLIEDVVTLARSGRPVEHPTAIDVAVAAEEAWERLDPAAASLSVPTNRVIRADRDRLVDLLAALFENAVAHGGEGVAVTVSVTADGFAVVDDGPGVPADEREAVFDPGTTGSTADDDSETGGFGLAIVREIARAHGWTVEMASPKDGDGTLVVVSGVEGAVD
jgi:PAS domain S-box-containing protein